MKKNKQTTVSSASFSTISWILFYSDLLIDLTRAQPTMELGRAALREGGERRLAWTRSPDTDTDSTAILQPVQIFLFPHVFGRNTGRI